MTALAELHRVGLVVAANDDRLTVKGPAPTIAAWRDFIREHKPQLLAELRPTRAVVSYDLIGDRGGLLIDPDGPASAVRELDWRFGNRLDWPALLAMFDVREQDADREAADLIRRLMTESNNHEKEDDT